MDSKAENVLIVESKNDKFFIETVIAHINKPNLQVAESFLCCAVDDYECMEGLDKEKIKSAIGYLKPKAARGYLKRVGIVIDHDHDTVEARLKFINEALSECFDGLKNPKLTTTSDFKTFKFLNAGRESTIEIACFLNGINQKGELETVLKSIASQTADYADCLNQWRACLVSKKKEFKQKDFDKLWINFYSRYDTCEKEEAQQAHSKCNFEAALKKAIWDFDSPHLDPLKAFLQLFT